MRAHSAAFPFPPNALARVIASIALQALVHGAYRQRAPEPEEMLLLDRKSA